MSTLYAKAGAALLIVLAIAGVLYGAYHHGVTVTDSAWQAKWADQQLLQAKALAAAATANRTEEQRRQSAVNEVSTDARTQITAATADAVTADAAGDRLHDSANKLAAGASCAPGDSGATERGKAATRAAMVLSDLLEKADRRAGDLAKFADNSRIAGLTCEKSYDSLTVKH